MDAESLLLRNGQTVLFRPVKKSDLKSLHEYVQKEQWPVGEYELQYCYQVGGIAAESEDGTVVGMAYSHPSCVFFDNRETDVPLGILIVCEDWRGRGVGTTLFEKAKACAKGKNITLCGVQTSVPYYKANGFKVSDFDIGTFIGKIENQELVAKNDKFIQKLTAANYEAMVAYDTTINLSSRKDFLDYWTNPRVTSTKIAIDGARKVVGYGCIQRIKGDHYIIAPLYANSNEIANNLFKSFSAEVPRGNNIIIHIPLCNTFMVKLTGDLARAFVTSKMYTLQKLPIDLSKVFGMTTLGITLI